MMWTFLGDSHQHLGWDFKIKRVEGGRREGYSRSVESWETPEDVAACDTSKKRAVKICVQAGTVQFFIGAAQKNREQKIRYAVCFE